MNPRQRGRTGGRTRRRRGRCGGRGTPMRMGRRLNSGPNGQYPGTADTAGTVTTRRPAGEGAGGNRTCFTTTRQRGSPRGGFRCSRSRPCTRLARGETQPPVLSQGTTCLLRYFRRVIPGRPMPRWLAWRQGTARGAGRGTRRRRYLRRRVQKLTCCMVRSTCWPRTRPSRSGSRHFTCMWTRPRFRRYHLL